MTRAVGRHKCDCSTRLAHPLDRFAIGGFLEIPNIFDRSYSTSRATGVVCRRLIALCPYYGRRKYALDSDPSKRSFMFHAVDASREVDGEPTTSQRVPDKGRLFARAVWGRPGQTSAPEVVTSGKRAGAG
ncbi:unnamed protein product, partial [Iphiclides podalirius]